MLASHSPMTFDHVMRLFRSLTILLLAVLVPYSPGPANADKPDYWQQSMQLYHDSIKAWLYNPILIEAIKTQNAAHSNLNKKDILTLDSQWVKETAAIGDRPLINTIMNKKASRFLQYRIKRSYGFITEIIVMDNKGLNVAISDITSDYWQGDEAKWRRTFLTGAHQIYISEAYYDESSHQLQHQFSITLSENDMPIGAITIGVNTEKLKLLK